MNGAESYFEDLLMRVIEGIATEDEFATFSEIIRIDADLRRRYAREMRLHALLCCQGKANAIEKDVPPCAASPKRGWTGANAGGRRGFNCWLKVAAAVAVLISGAAVWYAAETSTIWERFGTGIQSQTEPVLPAVRLVSQKGVKGLDLPAAVPGTLRIESGEVVVRLDTGVELTLIGPASVAVESGIRVGLEHGRLLANVPHWATGFSVWTRELEIYDLGTVFCVQVKKGFSDVFVFKGSVRVNEVGYDGWRRKTFGDGVGVCEAGEGVRAVAGKSPAKIAADWLEAERLFGTVQADRAFRDPAEALATATRIADLWAERYMPGSTLVAKKKRKGNGIPFEKTVWVRTSVPQQEGNTMNRASAAVALTAAAVVMGVGTTAATSVPIRIETSPGFSRHWHTVFTNEVGLKWDWCAGATSAELEINGMNGSFTTNFVGVTSNYLWRAFTTSAPSVEDVYDLRLTFYNGNSAVVGALTSRLAVVTAAFGKSAVIPVPSARGWTTVRDNAVISYDAGWAAATAGAMRSQSVIAKVGGSTQTNALSDAAGYYGWKIKRSDWGYGTFDLALTFHGMVGEWDATLTRPVDEMVIMIR